MKKNILILIMGICCVSFKANTSKNEMAMQATKFPTNSISCKKNKNLFTAIPHLDKIQDYDFKSVGCSFMNSIVVKYNHPTEKYYTFQSIIYQETTENKPMHNSATFGYEMASVTKVNGTSTSDLKTFNNAVLTIKNNPKYFDVSYVATYKKDYTIMISIRGKDLSNKKKVDDFLKKYLEAFNLDALK